MAEPYPGADSACGSLSLNFHLLVLDGVCRRHGEGRLRFVPVPAPSTAELERLVRRMAARIGRSRILEHLGRDAPSLDPAYPSRAPPKGDLSR